MTPIPHVPRPEKSYSHAVAENLTSSELQVLALLRNGPPGGLSLRQLQQQLTLPIAKVRTMCCNLKALGLLHISDSPDASPCTLYTLTALGHSLRHRTTDGFEEERGKN